MEQLREFLKILYIPSFGLNDIAEILIIVFILYKVISTLKNTRAWIILKGIIMLCVFYAIAYICSFNIIKMIFQGSIAIIAITLIVVFQQDIKKFLEQIGNKSIKQYFIDWKKKSKKQEKPERLSDKTIDELTKTLFALGETKTGSLIVIEKDIPLNDIIATGINVDAEVSSALLINIFEKNTPLHDGAVIIKNNRIASATCYLPLSNNPDISKSLGTRHRAGIGVTEAVDCLVLISSEETGKVSFVEDGKITRNVNQEKLKTALKKIKYYPAVELSLNPKKHLLNHNFKLKMLAMILGLFAWFAGTSALDPIITNTIEDIPITVINDSVILDTNKTYDLGEVQTVDVTVEDKRSIIDKLDKNDFTAVIDLSKLSYVNAVEVNVSVNNQTTEIKNIKDKVINVSLDDIAYTDFPIEIQTSGEPQEGYAIKQIDLSETSVTITGSENVIKKINKVVAPLNIQNVRDGQELQFTPIVYDKNGDTIDNKKLIFNIDKISAYIYLEKTKKIPLNISIVDDKNSAGQIKDITYEPTEVVIAGNMEKLDAMDSFDITLPVKIDISDDNNTKLTKVIPLRDYLPDGIYLKDENQKATITITYEPFPSKTFTINTSQIEIKNPHSEHIYTFLTDTINVSVIAQKDILNNLKNEDLKLEVNASDIIGVGTYDVTINISSNKNIIVSNLKTQMIVTPQATEEGR
ncbi:diadenylate cyclase CdaA [Thomasclavelia cocleata]|uniref:diadenylate cyclase CdaA n=1 Tax=Thomasclavelia cocleata TaxID=69824 RepID=UPI00256EFA69|nr:diadenylate cyclase CdaA [Thomasclavelia cocleata]